MKKSSYIVRNFRYLENSFLSVKKGCGGLQHRKKGCIARNSLKTTFTG